MPTIRKSDRRRLYIIDSIPWLLAAGTVMLFALLLTVVPDLLSETAIASVLPWWAVRAWGIAMLAGPVMIFVGTWTLNARWDVAGDLTLATWAIIYSYAVFVVRGPRTGLVACSLFAAFTVLCVGRAFVLAYEPKVQQWRRRT